MFNEEQKKAMLTGVYWCPKCGTPMMFEDEKWRDVLICTNPDCGFETDVDHYGYESEEEYQAQFPTKEEVLGYFDEDEDDYEESYDEVHGELDD